MVKEVIRVNRASAAGGRCICLSLVLLVVGCRAAGTTMTLPAPDRPAKPTSSFASRIAGLQRRDGLLTLYLDPREGKVWLEVPAPVDGTDEVGEYIYVEGLLTGLGSNPVGLDRGQIGRTRFVVFRRIGGRLLIEQPNLGFRALSDDESEKRAVRHSFASSVLWAGEVAEEASDGRALVDFTSFVVRDAHNVAGTLRRSGQGTFSLDKKRSVLDTSACLVFPDNVEFEAILTFGSSQPGRFVRATAPTAGSVTLVQHHSLIRPPDDGYKPRRFDPRSSSFGVRFLDYAAPLSESIETRWIGRHRLERTDPDADRSTVKEPIVYYVDSGAPEPIRSALVEGASWWNQAFEAAGFVDAFRVEVLPEGAHPLDVRYNLIQWVHRSTRGWSYGGSVMDPRTGEIIKGHVSLGSLRVRQDRLLFEGLFGTGKTGSGQPDDPVQLALSRIRQLSAHEVGHTLGFAHNYAASTYGGRASVMDYPAPLIKITENGELDASDAYAVGIGLWDKFAVRFAYSNFSEGTDERAALEQMIAQGLRDGLLFLTDADARPAGAAHPLASLWDNGADPVAELERVLEVRKIAIDHFGERNVMPGTPLALLQEVLAPVYFHHRYQLEAAVKVIGGLRYTYAVRGDGQPPSEPTNAEHQRRALSVALRAMSPEVLDLPDPVLALLLPRPFSYRANREMFDHATAPAFDALGAAATAANLALDGLLQPERCARLVDFHRRDENLPALEELLDRLVDHAFSTPAATAPRHQELRWTIQQVVVSRLMGLAANEGAPASVRSRAEYAIVKLQSRLSRPERAGAATTAHKHHLLATMTRFLNRPHESSPPPPDVADAPPGSPIGLTVPDLGHCSFQESGPGSGGR